MHQLRSDDLSLLERFFTDATANDPMLRAFLSGRVPGQAFVDVVGKPAACVIAVNYRFVFFGGLPSRKFEEQAMQQLRRQQALDVVWSPVGMRLPHGLKPDKIAPRVEFRRRENRGPSHLETLAAGAPHAEVERIDSRNIRRCLWRDDVLRATGSTSEFLGHGLGFCLMVDEAIVAEAYAVIWSGERAEIATVTHPQHRGHGYATVLCASLIKACEAVDLSTYWNCDEDNGTSIRLATRLGYTDVQQYRLLRYERKVV
jgi:RimJ/RimL family protein N-acetyltransferase